MFSVVGFFGIVIRIFFDGYVWLRFYRFVYRYCGVELVLGFWVDG